MKLFLSPGQRTVEKRSLLASFFKTHVFVNVSRCGIQLVVMHAIMLDWLDVNADYAAHEILHDKAIYNICRLEAV